MHEMQTIVTDVCGVCQSVCLSVMNAPSDSSSASLYRVIGGGRRMQCRVHGVIQCSLRLMPLASCLTICLLYLSMTMTVVSSIAVSLHWLTSRGYPSSLAYWPMPLLCLRIYSSPSCSAVLGYICIVPLTVDIYCLYQTLLCCYWH